MDLESNVLDADFVKVVNELFGVSTISYAPRFEILVPGVDESGRRRSYESDPVRIVASNEPKRVTKRRDPASTNDGIHFRVDYRDAERNRRSDMEFSPTRRSFLEAVNNAMPSLRYQQMRVLSDSSHTLKARLDIPEEGIVIDGRGPDSPVFFKFEVPHRIGGEEHRHDYKVVIPYFYIDGRDTANHTLNLYGAGDSLLLVGNYSGFFPAMGHADKVEEALEMKLPAMSRGDGKLRDSSVLREDGQISLLHYTNGKPDRNFATRLIVGDGEVRLVPGDEQTYSVTVDGRHVAEVSFRYNVTEYKEDLHPKKTHEGLTPSQLRDHNRLCCRGELQLTRIVNHTDEEWAGSLADYYKLAMPGMSVEQSGNSVHLIFEPFGIDCTIGRETTNGQSEYQINGHSVGEGNIGLGSLLNYVFERKVR